LRCPPRFKRQAHRDHVPGDLLAATDAAPNPNRTPRRCSRNHHNRVGQPAICRGRGHIGNQVR
jgi:hypothetical protein